MLKKISIFLLLLLLCACRPSYSKVSSSGGFDVLSFDQTASLSLLCFSNDEHNIELTSDLNTISESFDNKDKEIIIAPINLGVEKCLSADNYKLLAVLAHSHYYICARSETFSRGDIAVYGKGMVLEGVLNALSSYFGSYNFVYYDTLEELKSDLNNDVISAAVLSEIDFNDLSTNSGLELYKIDDLDSIYQSEYNYSDFPTYGLFVRNDVLTNRQDDLSEFIRKIRTSINSYKNDKTAFNKALENADIAKFGFSDAGLISESYNYCGICFEYAINEYDCLASLLSSLNIELSEKIIVQ